MADNIFDKLGNQLKTKEVNGIHIPYSLLTQLVNGDYVPIGADNPLSIASSTSESDIALGNISGKSIINKFGRNPDINASSAPEDIWNGGGLYSGFPTGVPEIVKISSTSSSDHITGLGARTIRLAGLDSGYNQVSELLNLSGTSFSNSTGRFSRIHSASIITAGASAFNVGEITCQHATTTGNIFFKMPVGRNQTNVAAYTIPSGYVGLIKNLNVFIRGNNTTSWAVGDIWVREFGSAPRLRRPWSTSFGIPYQNEIHGGLRLPEKTDMVIRVSETSNASNDIISSFDVEITRVS